MTFACFEIILLLLTKTFTFPLSDFSESLTHIAIFAVEVDGTKTLYRHFLRQTNGSLIEIGDDIEQHFSGQIALEKLLGGIEGREGEEKKSEGDGGEGGGEGVGGKFENDNLDFITQGNIEEFNKKFD